MARKIQFRRGIAATWTSTNPTLAIGEFGLETDTGRGKVGTGVTAWVSLPYLDAGAVAHIADTVAAHTAGAIAFTPAGTIAATDLQAAVVEVATDAAAATATVAGDLSTLSSATSDALALKAALASPALTGTPTAPTAVTATSTTQLATTAFVQQERAAQAATDSSRYGPGVFTVDSYLATTPSTATSAQTIAAYNAARDAAYAVGGTVKFTPGQTYQIDTTFIIKSSMTFDCSAAILKKRSTTGKASPLIVNESWSTGNTDITVIAHGSTWDFNGRVLTSGTGEPYGGLGDCAHFQNCDRLTIKGRPYIKDATKFALLIGHANDIEVDGARFDTRSDGFHGYGPMTRAKFGTFSGRTGDDFFALTISDYAAQITNLTTNGESTTLGDFKDITVDALLIDNSAVPTGGGTTGSGFALLGNSGSYSFDRIKVGVIEGTTKQAVRITNDATLTNTQVGTVTIGKVATVGIGAGNTQVQIGVTNADTITIGELSGEYGTSALLSVTAGTTRTINIGALTHTGASTGILLHLASGGVVESLNVSNVAVILGSAGRLIQTNQTGTIPRINVSNFDVSGTNGWAINVETAAVGARHRWSNGSFRQLNKTIRHAGGTNVVMLDNAEFDGVVMALETSGSSTTRMVAGAVRYTDSNSERYFKYDTSTFGLSGAQIRMEHGKVDNAMSVRGDLMLNTSGGPALGVLQYSGSAWAAI